MKTELNEVEINGIKYIKKETESVNGCSMATEPFSIIRCKSSGVFMANVRPDSIDIKAGIGTLFNARRLWYW